MRPLIEVCVEGLLAVRIAIKAGADRLELNSSLALEGLTPDLEDCVAARRMSNLPLIAMLRPHANGFVYDRDAREVILRDLPRLLECGVDGVAFGALKAEGGIDEELIAQVRQSLPGKWLVMHRAFDELGDQAGGLEKLIELGVDRVLTSGGAHTAEAGAEQLRKLVIQSRGRIEILPGAGIRPHNAMAILQATGCVQLHGTFKQALPERILPDPQAITELKSLQI
jgi:copper homeostasis protein